MTNYDDRLAPIDITAMILDCGHTENADRPGIHLDGTDLICTPCRDFA